jgi:hypothetical protein
VSAAGGRQARDALGGERRGDGAQRAAARVRHLHGRDLLPIGRFIDSEGWVVLERRLSIAPGQAAVNDVRAYGLEGVYTLEVVSSHKIAALLAEPAADASEELRRPTPMVLP